MELDWQMPSNYPVENDQGVRQPSGAEATQADIAPIEPGRDRDMEVLENHFDGVGLGHGIELFIH